MGVCARLSVMSRRLSDGRASTDNAVKGRYIGADSKAVTSQQSKRNALRLHVGTLQRNPLREQS
jgi:hypothetical protein